MKLVLAILILSTVFLQSVTTSPLLATHVITVGEVGIIQVQGPARVRGSAILLDWNGVAPDLAVYLCMDIIQVNWPTQLGHDSELEWSTDLKTWARSGIIHEGTGDDANYYTPSDGQKFFRVATK